MGLDTKIITLSIIEAALHGFVCMATIFQNGRHETIYPEIFGMESVQYALGHIACKILWIKDDSMSCKILPSENVSFQQYQA